MCGISCIIKKKKYHVDREEIQIMNDAMLHRGPDAEGIYVNGNVGFGHRRLSIVDLTSSGNQPMSSYDNRYVIVFNGEIYNFCELRDMLKKEGAVFKNETDTEVIIEAYRYWGRDSVKYFNGMWSIALLDIEQKTVFISRDRFGVKPLYIFESEDELIIASEIKAITAIRPEQKKVDITQVARYLAGIQEDMDEHTFYKNIHNFPKSCSMIYQLQDNMKCYQKYWEINVTQFVEKWKCNNYYKKFRELLEDSIRIRLRADVKVGASLSGGLDSSTIVSIATKKFDKLMHTFSSIYVEKNCNEKEFVDCINNECKTVPHYIYPDRSDHIMENMRNMVYYHDGPCHSASPYSGYCVYKEAKKNVKVLLDGQGADELFGGYLFLYNANLKELLRQNTWMSKLKAINMVFSYQNAWQDRTDLLDDKLLLKILGIKEYSNFKKQNDLAVAHMPIRSKIKCSNGFEKVDLENKLYIDNTVINELDKELYLQLQYKMLPRILHDVDRNSMANSLEVRLPFLDYRLVEFSYTLSNYSKMYRNWTKYIIRKSCKKYLPKKIYGRRNKMGFPAPFDKWLKDERCKDEIQKYIFGFMDRNVIDNESLKQHYKAHMLGKEDCSVQLFRIMMLEIWLRDVIDTQEEKWIFKHRGDKESDT